MDKENLSVYGITLSSGTEMTVLSEFDTLPQLMDHIRNNHFITLKTGSKWNIDNEEYLLNNVVIRCSDISAVYW